MGNHVVFQPTKEVCLSCDRALQRFLAARRIDPKSCEFLLGQLIQHADTHSGTAMVSEKTFKKYVEALQVSVTIEVENT
jgi:hypothetical protein